jgi:hypothetical protein
MEVKKISEMIEQIIDRECEKAVLEQGGSWKEKYEWLCDKLNDEYEHAKALHSEFDKKELSVNKIESEGAVRIMTAILEIVDMINSSYKKEQE